MIFQKNEKSAKLNMIEEALRFSLLISFFYSPRDVIFNSFKSSDSLQLKNALVKAMLGSGCLKPPLLALLLPLSYIIVVAIENFVGFLLLLCIVLL